MLNDWLINIANFPQKLLETIPFVEAAYLLGHLGVNGGSGCFPLLGNLIEGIHVGLVGGHLLLERLQ